MYHRFQNSLRIPSLLLAAVLQLLPLVRAALPAAQSASSVMAIIFRWGAGFAAALGSIQAVSGASTVITSPLNQTATNGVPLGNSQIRLTTAPDAAHYWEATGLPRNLYLTNTSSTAWYIRGTPAVAGTFNIGLTAKDDATSGSSRTTTATMVLNVLPVTDHPIAHAKSTNTVVNRAVAITLTGEDSDGDKLTYLIVTAPAHGTLSGAPPAVMYHPATNYIGADTFSFNVYDGHVESAPANVSINVTAAPAGPILATPKFTAGQLLLKASGGPGQIWTVQRVAPLNAGWTNLGTMQLASDGTGQFIVTNLSSPAGFFRLKQP